LLREQFPSTTLQVLTDHCDEIWFCKFSNDGLKLATGSKDGTLIIWDVNPLTLKVTLNKSYDEHTCGVGWISWSPDDRYVIVCGTEECTELWIWDIEVSFQLYLDYVLISELIPTAKSTKKTFKSQS
jgi:WD40 repeat protein